MGEGEGVFGGSKITADGDCSQEIKRRLLLGESHRGRSLVGYSPWGHKESDMTEPMRVLRLVLPAKLNPFGGGGMGRELSG